MNTPFVTQKYTHEIVTLQMAKEWLRMDIEGYNEEDNAIKDAIKGAVGRVETKLGYPLGISEYTWNIARLPVGFCNIPYIREIVGIEYKGETNYEEVLTAQYELLQISERGSIIIWNPEYRVDTTNVRLKFRAGFAEDEVPGDLMKAIRAMVVEEFDNRGDYVSEKKTLSDKLINPYLFEYAG